MSGGRTSWIPPALARARGRRIHDLTYRLDMRIDRRACLVAGRSVIAFELARPRAHEDLVLDWRPECTRQALDRARESLRVNGHALPKASVRIGSGHIVIAARHVQPGANRIELDWNAPIRDAGAALTRFRDPDDGSLYVYTLFVPADASAVFPCFEQPDLKARFVLTLTLPGAWRAIANAPAVRVESRGQWRVHRFAPTEPISTYVFAFAAGPFAALGAQPDGGALWVRRSQVRRAQAHRDEILASNARALRFFARYFGHRFPFAKYDLVAIPDLPYRGMEHAGATFLAEKDLFPSSPCPLVARWERAQLLFHECAHQWAGNLVTMRAFDDLWLKEGFANFMAYKLAARVFPSALAAVAFHRLKLQACHSDESGAASALHHRLPDAGAAKWAYGSIVYAKAPALLRQLEFVLGAERFRTGVRLWIRRHAYRAADWRDLIGALETASGRSLARFAAAWILRPGVPKLQASIDSAAAGNAIIVGQTPAGRVRNGRWPLALQVAIEAENGRVERRTIAFDAATTRLALGPRHTRIRSIALNCGDDAYALAVCAPSQLEAVAQTLGRERSALARIQRWESLWQAVRDAALDPARFVVLALERLGAERNEFIVSAVLQRIELAMERFLDAGRRDALAPRVDGFLLERLRSADPARVYPWLDGAIALAGSESGLDLLQRVALGRLFLRGDLPPRLRTRAALMMVVRGAWSASRAARTLAHAGIASASFRLQLAAARPDAASKREVAARLVRDRSLADEPVLACLEFLNHPAHAALTRALLAPALRALPRLERQRKIFFVNRWIGAFVGGQHSAAAHAIVSRALAASRLDEPLRRKLLEGEYELTLVVRSRHRWSRGRTLD